MRIVEFRIPLPFSVEEYNVCQRFNVAKASFEQTVNGKDGVHILASKPISERNRVVGQYTHKRISFASKVPSWIQSLIKKEWLCAEEMSWNTYPKFKTTYKSAFIPNLEFTVLSMHHEGVLTESNALKLDDELLPQRSIIDIDILNDPITPKDYNEQEDPHLCPCVKERYGKLSKDWKETCPTVMTCYKVLFLHIPLGWAVSGKIETTVVKTLQCMFLLHHRRALCSLEQWTSLSMEDVRHFELHVERELNKVWEARFSGAACPQLNFHPLLQFSSREMRERKDKPPENTLAEQQRKDQGDSSDAEENAIGTEVNLHHIQSWGVTKEEAGEQSKDFLTQEVIQLKNGLTREGVYDGIMYKLGDGYLNPFWYQRYVKLQGSNLTYYGSIHEKTPRGTVNLQGASVRWSLEEVRGRSYSILIEPIDDAQRPALWLSGETEESTKDWMVKFQMAALELVKPCTSPSTLPCLSAPSETSSKQPYQTLPESSPVRSRHSTSCITDLLCFTPDIQEEIQPWYLMRSIGKHLLESRRKPSASFPSTIEISKNQSLIYTRLQLPEDHLAVYVDHESSWNRHTRPSSIPPPCDSHPLTKCCRAAKSTIRLLFLWMTSCTLLNMTPVSSCDSFDTLTNPQNDETLNSLQDSLEHHKDREASSPLSLWHGMFLLLFFMLLGVKTRCVISFLFLSVVLSSCLVFFLVFLLVYTYQSSFMDSHGSLEPHRLYANCHLITSVYLEGKHSWQILPWIVSCRFEQFWNNLVCPACLVKKSVHTQFLMLTSTQEAQRVPLGPFRFKKSPLTRVVKYMLQSLISSFFYSPNKRLVLSQRHWGMLDDSTLFVATGSLSTRLNICHLPTSSSPTQPSECQQNLMTLEKHMEKVMALNDCTAYCTSSTLSRVDSSSVPLVDYVILLPDSDGPSGVQLIRYTGVNPLTISSLQTSWDVKTLYVQVLQRYMLEWARQFSHLVQLFDLFDKMSLDLKT